MCEQRIDPVEEVRQANEGMLEEIRALPVAINGVSWEEHLRRVAQEQQQAEQHLCRVGGHLVPISQR